jgi:hypothetical protein
VYKSVLLKAAIVIALFAPLNLFSQSSLPTVIPPAPESAALFRYLDHTVNGASGVPEISVPLYQIVSGSLQMPLSVSYDATGRRISDQTGPVGMNWNLIGGGRISRTVKGAADELVSFPTIKDAAQYDLHSTYDFDDLNKMSGGNIYDSQYDIFSYNCGLVSGKFIRGNGSNPLVLIPVKPVQISSGSGGSSQGFPDRITDEKGNLYEFDLAENCNISNYNIISSRLLTRVVSPDKKDVITLTYLPFSVQDDNYSGTLTAIDNDDTQTIPAQPSKNYSEGTPINNTTYTVQRLSEITFKLGRVKFNLVQTTGEIESMQVFDKDNKLLRTISFVRSTLDAPSFTGPGNKLKLDALIFKASDNAVKERYTFLYNASSDFNGHNRDIWGFRNSSGNFNNQLIPNFDIFMVNTGSVNFTLNSATSANRSAFPITQGLLSKIIYPTGGSTEYVFEGNRYKYTSDDPSVYGPGLRVSTIRTSDNKGNILVKTFKYGENEDGNGYFPGAALSRSDAFIHYTSTQSRYIVKVNATQYGSKRTRVYSSELNPEIAETVSEPVTYSKITVYEGTPEKNTGKTVYGFQRALPNSVYFISAPGFYGSTSPYYNAFNNWITDPNIGTPYTREYNYYSSEHLTSTDYYKYENDSYTKLRSVSNQYEDTPTQALHGLIVKRVVDNGYFELASSPLNFPVFQVADYYVNTGTSLLKSSTDTQIENGQEFTTRTDYTYNSKQLTNSVAVTKSNGEKVTTSIKYPFDVAKTVHTQMINSNMLDYRVEEEAFKGSASLSANKTDYKDWGNDIIAPEIISSKTGSSAYEARIKYLAYSDRSHPSGVSKVSGPPVSYLYQYLGQYPVAEAANAKPGDIWYEGFENGGGNSGLNDARTGHYSKTGGYAKSLSGLTNGKYTLTYWKKSGGLWTFSANENVNVTAGNYSIAIPSSEQVDDVRFYPAGAQMRTFTFDPLIGMTSLTDAKGQVSFFHYDNYQRLSEISDTAGNIKQHFSYNQLNPLFYSDAMSANARKNNCPPGFYGETVTYTLQEAAFTSAISVEDANQKAAAQLASYKQTYANENGNCLQYYSEYQFRWIQKNNCSSGIGQEVMYEVPARKYTSGISVDDANQQAINEINSFGQAWANANGVCLTEPYKSEVVQDMVSRVCDVGYVPSPAQVNYKLDAGMFTSLRSVADATSKAQTYWVANREAYATAHSSCNTIGTKSFSVANNTRYAFNIRLNSGSVTENYSIPSGASTSISFPAYSSINIYISNTDCGSCTFRFTYGTQVINGGSASFMADSANSINIGNGIAN